MKMEGQVYTPSKNVHYNEENLSTPINYEKTKQKQA